MYQNIGKYFIEDYEIKTADMFQFQLKEEKIIYEVIRVIKNQPLFLEDHLERLAASLMKSGLSLDLTLIEEGIKKLIELNPNMDKNIKVDVTKNSFRVYFMESFYPDEDYYKVGVKVKTAQIVRHNPTVKALNMDYKKKIEKIKNDCFEVLLVNESGEVTEGSRANLIFVKDDTLYSTPVDQILVGVTFKNVLKMAIQRNIQVKYEATRKIDLEKMNACFLTGTSLGILPICQIDELKFDSVNDEVVLKLMQAYEKTIEGER